MTGNGSHKPLKREVICDHSFVSRKSSLQKHDLISKTYLCDIKKDWTDNHEIVTKHNYLNFKKNSVLQALKSITPMGIQQQSFAPQITEESKMLLINYKMWMLF